MEISKEQRNAAYLNKYREDLVMKLDEVAYRLQHTKDKKLKAKLEKEFDKRMGLIIQLASGNVSTLTHWGIMLFFACTVTKLITVSDKGKEETTAITNGTQIAVDIKKEVVPGLNYYRRDIQDSRIGAGIGVDTNGQANIMLGLDF